MENGLAGEDGGGEPDAAQPHSGESGAQRDAHGQGQHDDQGMRGVVAGGRMGGCGESDGESAGEEAAQKTRGPTDVTALRHVTVLRSLMALRAGRRLHGITSCHVRILLLFYKL
ncbi:hypothetical protein GCM10011401_25000 [Nesterenkonia cremea]|uniref:Uncharacterized protein n=1 Tax=Nesterenkonia cremea TaxID=1882340 RepID=A0A917AV06_9MICC|nr:hypothetical protein GCM10011401_25000 [Nesterenkonia cremea]